MRSRPAPAKFDVRRFMLGVLSSWFLLLTLNRNLTHPPTRSTAGQDGADQCNLPPTHFKRE